MSARAAFMKRASALLARDPLLALTALLSALAGGALGATGEITLLALGVPVIALVAVSRPVQAPRGRLFEALFQVLALAFLVYFVLSLGQGRILAGAVALTLPVQAHSLLGMPTHRALRRLHVLSFFQLLALASSTTQVIFGPVLVIHLVLSPLVLTLAALERAQGEPRTPVAWSTAFLRPALGASVSCLALGIVVFLMLPRYEMGLLHALSEPGQRMSGFSDSVSLGDITSIQVSDKIVLRARVIPEDAEGVPLRWRGKAYDSFNGRDWSVSPEFRAVPRQGDVAVVGASSAVAAGPGDAKVLRRVMQEMTVEPLRVRAIFALASARALTVTPETFQGVLVDDWGNLARGGEGVRRLRYSVVSEIGPDARELSDAEREAFLALPLTDERIPELARTLAGEGDAAIQAARLEAALQGDWTYSLDVSDGNAKDPIARFLLEKAPGHCEYFASGMVILLRAQGIPARLVTGFQQGEWSWLFRLHIVRQRDAHAWVEAWIPGSGWTTFDPTPLEGREVDGDVASLGLLDRLEMAWDDNVIGFNYTFQVGFLITMRDAVGDAIHALTRRPATGLGIFLGLVAASAALVILLTRRGGRRRGAGQSAATRHARERAAFYASVQRVLARRGYRRDSGETPLEVAERAAREAGAPGAAAVSLTRMYYAARFGEHEPDPDRVRSLLRELEALAPRR